MTTYEDFRKQTPKVTGSLVRMRQESFKDSVVPAKYKILAALSIVIVTKCEPCIKAYTKMAVKAGVSHDEFVEFLNVAITEGGCPGEQWAFMAYQVYQDLLGGADIQEEVCCE
jgi:AhpD family alkylhydroperoxidase